MTAADRDAPAAGGTGGAATEAEVAELRKRYAARLFSMRENAAGPALYFGDLDGIVFEDGLHEDMGSNLVLWLNKRLADDREAQATAAEAEIRALREEVGRLTREAERKQAATLGLIEGHSRIIRQIEDRATAAEADAARAREERDAARAGRDHQRIERRRNTVRGVIAWLHRRADAMADPHARGVLNSAAHELGLINAVDKPRAALVDHAPTCAGPAGADGGMQSATPTSTGDGHARE